MIYSQDSFPHLCFTGAQFPSCSLHFALMRFHSALIKIHLGFPLLWGHDSGFLQTCLDHPVLLFVRINSNSPNSNFRMGFFLNFLFTKWCLLFATHALKGMLQTWKTCTVHTIYQFLSQISLCVSEIWVLVFFSVSWSVDFLSHPYLWNGMCYSHFCCVFSSYLQMRQGLYICSLSIWPKMSMYIVNLFQPRPLFALCCSLYLITRTYLTVAVRI